MKLNHLRAICIAILLGYLVACLWPFNPHPKNNTKWRQRSNSFQLGWQSIAYSERDLEIGSQAVEPQDAGSISIEIWLRSHLRGSHEVHSIFSLYDGSDPENLVIAEWQSTLLIRTAVWTTRGEKRYREIGLTAALPEGGKRFITFTSGPGGTVVYLDGAPAKSLPKLFLRPETLRGRILLGSSSRGKNKWSGEIFGLAVFRTTLNPADVLRQYRLWTGGQTQAVAAEIGLSALYLFNEGKGRTIWDHSPSGNSLLIPEYFEVFRKTVLHPPWRDDRINRSDWEDIILNVLGFMPFGFFYFIYRRRLGTGHYLRDIVATGLAAAVISMAIELMQVFLPMRDSSLTDVICNVLGAYAGILPAAILPRQWLENGPDTSVQRTALTSEGESS